MYRNPAEVEQEQEPTRKRLRQDDIEVDVPIPTIGEPVSLAPGISAASAFSSRDRRRREYHPEDDRRGKYRRVEADDPDDPEDNEAGSLQVPEVLMRGQRRARAPVHPGKYKVRELFSPP